jgi:cell division protein FtsA
MKRKIAAIDVGTTKVCTIMGVLDSVSGLRVLGVGIAPSHGIQKALVADASKAIDSIRESISKAETMAGYRLASAFIGVTGRHINSLNSKATIAITHNDMLVRTADLKRGLNVALNVKIPPEQKVLHVIPRSYKLDGNEVIDPVGMNGSEMDVDVHIITASIAPVQNLTKCVKSLGVNVDDLILEPLASAESVLTEQEKEAGVLLADIGGGTTDIAIIKDGSIYYTSVIPVAGHQMTTDLSTGLGLSYDLAEEMKKKYGILELSDESLDPSKMLDDGGQSVSYLHLCQILQMRVEELVRLIVLDFPRSKSAKLIPAGIVLTGGCANIPGLAALGERMTGLPVRIGMPTSLGGVSPEALGNPAYSTSVGLILWSMKHQGTSYWFSRPRGLRGFLSQIFRIFR